MISFWKAFQNTKSEKKKDVKIEPLLGNDIGFENDVRAKKLKFKWPEGLVTKE